VRIQQSLLRVLTVEQQRSITPPPLIGEERDEESGLLEAQARQDLESEGCAPCYPARLEVPVRHPPEKYRQIIEYWQSLRSTDDVVLCAQRQIGESSDTTSDYNENITGRNPSAS